jgi:predicted anti-sigma-YlaC factor YlaD
MPDLTYSCQRARAFASRNLDGELSEIEARLLERHLANCPACVAHTDDIVRLTTLLREAPLEQYRFGSLPRSGVVRRAVRGRFTVVAAGLLGAAAALTVVASIVPATTITPPGSEVTVVTTPTVSHPEAGGKGVPVMTRLALPIGQLNAVDDF